MMQAGPDPDGQWVTMRFSLPASCGAERVCLVGDFNGWQVDATPLERTAAGFEVAVALQRGRTYRFRYLLDGTRWENDWAADDYEPNSFGGDDSVIDLRDRFGAHT